MKSALILNAVFILGWRYRVTGPIFACLFLAVLSYRNSWSMIYHSANLAVLHVIVLAVAPAADRFSLDARRSRNRRTDDDWGYGWPIRLICAITVSAYFVSGVAKVAGPLGWSWGTGEALRGQVAADAIRKEVLGDKSSPLFYALYNQIWLFTILAVVSLAVEIGAPLILLHRRLAYAWCALAFFMHWGIFGIMGITFPYQLSGVAYASFFYLERLPWIRRDSASTPTPSVAA